jgi:hypothetical protein
MHSRNFPAKVHARKTRALARMKGPSDPTPENLERFNTEKANLTKAINSFVGNPLALRSKKDRRDRAKVK